MPTLVWKLLRQHISIGQLAGFFLANLFGMMIVLLSVQFYKDVIPVFTEGDSHCDTVNSQPCFYLLHSNDYEATLLPEEY